MECKNVFVSNRFLYLFCISHKFAYGHMTCCSVRALYNDLAPTAVSFKYGVKPDCPAPPLLFFQ